MNRLSLAALAALTVILGLKISQAIGATKIDPSEANALVSSGKAVLVDVREKEEVEAGMLPGALWLPLSGLQSGNPEALKTLESIEKGKTVIAYCRSGGRAGKAGALLEPRGFQVKNLGGYEAAKAAFK